MNYKVMIISDCRNCQELFGMRTECIMDSCDQSKGRCYWAKVIANETDEYIQRNIELNPHMIEQRETARRILSENVQVFPTPDEIISKLIMKSEGEYSIPLLTEYLNILIKERQEMKARMAELEHQVNVILANRTYARDAFNASKQSYTDTGDVMYRYDTFEQWEAENKRR